MRTDSLLPRLVLLVCLALVAALALPSGGGPHAVAGESEGGEGGAAGPQGEGATEGEAAEEDDWLGETSFSEAEVNKAIDLGVSWLSKKQSPDGSWGEVVGSGFYGGGQDDGSRRAYTHPAGPTALALYTLLKCGVDPKNPLIRNGFKYIKDNNYDMPGSTYEASVLLLALCATGGEKAKSAKRGGKVPIGAKYRGWAQKLKDHIVDKRRSGLRGWRYNVGEGESHGGDEDLSSTQLVALSLFAAHRAGMKVKKRVWEDILQYSLDQQMDEGTPHEIHDPAKRGASAKYQAVARGFAYIKGDEEGIHGKPYGSMTACGLANVEMARYVLSDGMSEKGAAKWAKRDDAEKIQKSLYDALAWLDLNWSAFKNPVPGVPNANTYHVYYLYSLERAMDLFELNRVGSHLWYSEMGQELLNAQRDEGFWKTNSTHEPRDVLDTCFALLFLRRATAGQIPYGEFTGGGGQARDNR